MARIENKSGESTARHKESGNVLFLILIAVALFAALSYAVTQSSRSGSGQATSEKSLLSGAQITQYPAGVRTDIIRMMIDSNTSVDQLEFNAPSDFATLTVNPGGKFVRGVFHPDGGGATYQNAPADVMDNGSSGTWYYNADFFVPNIGTTTIADSSGNEVIAFLPGIKLPVCQKIDDALGISSSPVPTVSTFASTAFKKTLGTGAGSEYELFAAAPAGTQCIDTVACPSTPVGALGGQPFGCFKASDNQYVYYHVLLER